MDGLKMNLKMKAFCEDWWMINLHIVSLRDEYILYMLQNNLYILPCIIIVNYGQLSLGCNFVKLEICFKTLLVMSVMHD